MKYYLEAYDHGVKRMLGEDVGWKETDDINKANVVVFTGGDDVNPSLYGEYTHPSTYSEYDRHTRCLDVYRSARKLNLPMIGICRGSQFLCVMSGNRLWQDVTKHAIYGTHLAVDIESGEEFQVTSTHHQMMRMGPADTKSVVLTRANLGSCRSTMSDMPDDGSEMEIEAMYHPQINALSYQPHPEYLPSTHRCRTKFWEYVEDCLGL